MTPRLHALITQSSRPLRAVEIDCAGDSSGFSTSRCVPWFDEKYGVQRRGHDGVKIHLLCGVKTNIVTAVRIEGRAAADCPQLPPLLKETAANFTVKAIALDKAYLSVDNLEALAGLGARPYSPFKVNSTPDSGGLWGKWFHSYAFNREEFLKHYHKRSNVESTISMIKAKCRDPVRSKTDPALKHEVLCKVLCHNRCCVIQSQCELGIEPVFWEDEPVQRPDGLPLVRPG